MYRFPKDLYADIRLEDVFQTSIVYENGALTQNKTSREAGAFLRVWDGQPAGITAPPQTWATFSRSWMPWRLWPPPIRPSVRTQWSPGLRSTGTMVSGIKIEMCGKYPTRKRLPCSSPIYLW